MRQDEHLASRRHAIAAASRPLAVRASRPRLSAQTYGFATLQPGTLNHTTASAIAKVLKEKAGLNMLVQPTAGDTVIIPMVAAARPSRHGQRAWKSHDG